MRVMTRVLVAEDEPRMADAVARVLSAEHCTVDIASDGTQELGLLGLQISTPVLMVTALSALEHRIEGLDAGADDYLPKPFAFSELLARLRALTRRSPELVDERIAVGDIELNPDRHQVTV